MSVEQAIEAALANREQPDEPMIFLCQCETSRLSYTAGLQRAHTMGMLTILNAAPIPREPLEDELLALVDILVVNEIEAASLAQAPVHTPEQTLTASTILLKRGPKHVLITLGERGCLWSYRKEGSLTPEPAYAHMVIPAFAVDAVDATAAGDAFCGALAACLNARMSMEQALERASAAGALTVTRQGAITALPTAQEVERFLQQRH